ncbi:hypothetical protein SBA5_890015 [Candidatus Sulfotelmatomonas gaucii]|uniref:Uncharacterized protein n=1 Tax=Candidatus Sulfuritelmatomonas gaucii TaxID=2043161 RepID=A0A2N9M7W7_9BACT|nr:hypothetical protein SBA5_890015 [Candidatus Sulfotelmatomonas gaucii]
MVESDLTFLLIPMAPALAFMLWVIWALEKQIRRDRRHSDEIARLKAGSDHPASTSAAPKQHGAGTSVHLNFARQP